MRIVVALGGNALLKRGEPMTAAAQHANVRVAAAALADLARDHQIIVTHGNGPQVGLMALQAASYAPEDPWPLDVLGAETQGMIGYLIEQELMNALPIGSQTATLVTRVAVEASDPAFERPTKPIGPVYSAETAKEIGGSRKWTMAPQAEGGFRRVVPSPIPVTVIGIESIQMLVNAGVYVVCAGGGGIPVLLGANGRSEGVEAVIDKDRTSGLLAKELDADILLMLTDVEAVFRDWGKPGQQPLRDVTPGVLDGMQFAAGSMAPKIETASAFVRSGGKLAGIGQLQDARAIVEGTAGTRVRNK